MAFTRLDGSTSLVGVLPLVSPCARGFDYDRAARRLPVSQGRCGGREWPPVAAERELHHAGQSSGLDRFRVL